MQSDKRLGCLGCLKPVKLGLIGQAGDIPQNPVFVIEMRVNT